MKPKFEVGQKVIASDGEVCEILSFSYDSVNGFRYVLSSKELDYVKKETIEGIKNCTEDELKAYVEKK
jgi:hypothetical protein